MSIIEDRIPYINGFWGGNINAAGICAYSSAVKDDESIYISIF